MNNILCFRLNFKTEIEEDLDKSLMHEGPEENLLAFLASLHDQLCTTISLINNCFSFTLASFIIAILISTIFSSFELYSVIASSAQINQRVAFCLISNAWNFLLFSFTFITICACSFTKKEARGSSTILHKALHYQESDAILKRVRLLGLNFFLCKQYKVTLFSNFSCETSFNNCDTLRHASLADCFNSIGQFYIR